MQYQSKYTLAQSTIDNIHMIYRNDWGHVDTNLLLDVLERRGKDYVRNMLSPNASWTNEQIEDLKGKWILDTKGNVHKVLEVFTIAGDYGRKAIQLDTDPKVVYSFSNNNRCHGLIILDVFTSNPIPKQISVESTDNIFKTHALNSQQDTDDAPALTTFDNQDDAVPYKTLASQLSTFDNDNDEDGNED
ncbi:hypothetical protein Presley_6 [Acinetobacter phage Presley]|uniref:Uncharacterized protein n=1 Tax=Acinetobacter phage Presley TaxID=1406780 RepID=U5PZT7_9CAUD|nr:hypothetical protein Presley_6 [Acinetobacter phage Presley]AGY48073.1 hypothetical protein Presley_6 [Acinetobacter phage Presley]